MPPWFLFTRIQKRGSVHSNSNKDTTSVLVLLCAPKALLFQSTCEQQLVQLPGNHAKWALFLQDQQGGQGDA